MITMKLHMSRALGPPRLRDRGCNTYVPLKFGGKDGMIYVWMIDRQHNMCPSDRLNGSKDLCMEKAGGAGLRRTKMRAPPVRVLLSDHRLAKNEFEFFSPPGNRTDAEFSEIEKTKESRF